MGIANSEFDIAKENWINMYKDFLQNIETEFEETLNSTKGFEWAKLRKQVAVFEVLHCLENVISIHTNFFCKEVKLNALSSGESDESKYQKYLDEVLADVLKRLKREFDIEQGRLQLDFPHRIRFSSSLISKYITENLKSFILTWLETDEKSKETFLIVLNLTIKTFKTFKEDLNNLVEELKIGNEITAGNLIDEIFLPFRKNVSTKRAKFTKDLNWSWSWKQIKAAEKVQNDRSKFWVWKGIFW